MNSSSTTQLRYWTDAQKNVLRFFLILFPMFMVLTYDGIIPYTNDLSNIYLQFFHKLIPWFAAHILHLAKPITVFTNGSGDTTYDYLNVMFIAVAALLGTSVWSIADRKSRNYDKILYWLCVVVRYYIICTMISYGLVKIIKLQFPSPSPYRLTEQFGDASPMGLAWTYLGYSTGFNYFTGLAELSCGILLLFRRTATFGSLLTLTVTGNIMAINYCYDVPVKVMSTSLVLMSVFLVAMEAQRLVNFFFINNAVEPSIKIVHRFNAPWKNTSLIIIKYLFVAYCIAGSLIFDIQYARQYGDDAAKTPFYGIYDVQDFIRNRDTIAPLATDNTRWRRLIIDNNKTLMKMMNDSSKRCLFVADLKKHTIVISLLTDTVNKHLFHFTEAKNGDLLLKGKWGKDSLSVSMRKYNLNHFLLIRRGFHWINEYPYNR
jgi:hypothetical protein